MEMVIKTTLRGRCGGMPVIPALGRRRQEHHEFKTSLGNTVSSRLAWDT
jgi:hypothetical protein